MPDLGGLRVGSSWRSIVSSHHLDRVPVQAIAKEQDTNVSMHSCRKSFIAVVEDGSCGTRDRSVAETRILNLVPNV